MLILEASLQQSNSRLSARALSRQHYQIELCVYYEAHLMFHYYQRTSYQLGAVQYPVPYSGLLQCACNMFRAMRLRSFYSSPLCRLATLLYIRQLSGQLG